MCDRISLNLQRDHANVRPIEACVILLPMFEFLHRNSTFRSILADSVSEAPTTKTAMGASSLSPLPYTLITLSSYVLAHATSLASTRAIAYANLALHILLVFVETDELSSVLCLPSSHTIWLCRQVTCSLSMRMLLRYLNCTKPLYVIEGSNLTIINQVRAPLCSILDCCVLWLRHNLHLQLEVHLYL